MDDYYFELPLSNARALCFGPITKKEADAIGSEFCDGLGTYLFLANADAPREDIEIIAKIVSTEAATRLRAALSGHPLVRPVATPERDVSSDRT